MLIDRKREKLIQAIIYFAKNTKKLGITKLLKLLYYFDFQHFQKYGISVTGSKYHAWPNGPVQVDLYNQLNSLKSTPDLNKAIAIIPVTPQFNKIVARKPFNEKSFSKRQLDILRETAFVFKDADAESMVKSTHMPNDPWDITYRKKGARQLEIDYMLALDNPKCIDYETARERQEEVEDTLKMFS